MPKKNVHLPAFPKKTQGFEKNEKKREVYLDYAAATPVDPGAFKAMSPYFSEKFGNSASLHKTGLEAKKALEKSRAFLAGALGAKSEEIIFTSSATESNNLALKGAATANKERGGHIIVSSVEHDCVLNSAKWLEQADFKLTLLPVDKYGLVDSIVLKRAIQKETILVSVIHGSNELGTIQPIAEIGRICKKAGVLFHTDASQTFGKIPVDVRELNVDLLTASSHKIYGPKGAALLYVKAGTRISPILHGGEHEQGLRPSTVNVPAVVGFAKAAEICQKEMPKESKRLFKLRDKLIKGILEKVPYSHLTGHPKKRLPNHASFWFSFVEGEAVVLLLDSYGISAATGSACSSLKLEPSPVLLACGLRPEQAHGSLRLTLGRWTKPSDINYVRAVLPNIIKKLRKISPYGK